MKVDNIGKKIGKSFIIMLGGIMISNFYSIAYFIITNKWFSMLELMQLLENQGETTSAITIMLFTVIGKAFAFLGIYNAIQQTYRYVKENVIKNCK